jgi:thioredoxin reductase (NADPH)
VIDTLIVGGGPAGLTAAIYLARFHREAVLVDNGRSRARYIPVTRNTPGFPGGIDGPALLASLREQAARFGLVSRDGWVDSLETMSDGFFAKMGGEAVEARTVVLASGIEDVLPPLEGVEEAICRGAVRLCAVCDAYETDGKRVAVYGSPERAASHAKYMRTFTRDVTLVCCDGKRPDRSLAIELEGLGIEVIDDADGLVWNEADGIRVERSSAPAAVFDAFYPCLGLRARSTLATSVGARCTDDGDLYVDAHQQTSVEGLYAAGDIVTDLNQISVAYGHAAIAATAIHNRLPMRARP